MKKIIFIFFLVFLINSISFALTPETPSNFKITNTYTSAIMLNWNSTSEYRNCFILERSIDGVNWNFTKYIYPDCFSYFDVGLIKNNEYFYRIYSINNDGKSEYAKTISGVTMSLDDCTIGTDTVSISYPFFLSFSDSRTQMLYKKIEVFSSTCTHYSIFDMNFYITDLPTSTINNLTIRMQSTQDTVLTGFVNTNWTTVYSNNLQLFHTGWNQIYLNQWFIPDQSKNLLIEICFDNTSYTNNIKVRSSVANNKVWHYHVNNSSGCTLTGGTVQNYRPNINFTSFINTVVKINKLVNPEYKLEQNFPNPFNGSTKFRFSIKKSNPVTLSIYDILGKQEVVVFSEPLGPGEYEKIFSSDKYPLPSGIYYYCLSTQEYSEVKKLVILK